MATKKQAVKQGARPVLNPTGNDADTLVLARERFTRETALAIGTDPEAAAAYAKDALTAWTAGEREGMRASVYAAMAAAVAVRSGILTDGPKPKNAADGVMSPKEYGEAWITPAHPEGVSRQMVDTWIRAGEAFLGWDVDPESAEGKRLLGGLAQSAAWNAKRKALKQALADEEIAPEDVTPALVTGMIAEVTASEKQREADAAQKRKDDAAKRSAEIAAEVAKSTADRKQGKEAPLADRIAAAEALIANLRPTVAAERRALEELAARIAARLTVAEAS